MKGGSIGFRLAAWYCAVFALGLAAFGVAAWFAMRASIYHAIDDELRGSHSRRDAVHGEPNLCPVFARDSRRVSGALRPRPWRRSFSGM